MYKLRPSLKNRNLYNPNFQNKSMPEEKTVSWVKIKPEELEKIVIELAKQDNTPAKIGLVLRDKYGIPKAKILGKKITKILKDSGVEYQSEKDIIGEKAEKLKIHKEKHKHDKHVLRSLAKKLWLFNRLTKS